MPSCFCQTELVCNVCHQALKNLGAQMERVLLSDRNPKVTMDGIRSFNVDLKHCQSEWNKGLFHELSSVVICLLAVPTAVPYGAMFHFILRVCHVHCDHLFLPQGH